MLIEGKRIEIPEVQKDILKFSKQLNKIRVAINKWEKDKPEDCVNTYLSKITDKVEDLIKTLKSGYQKMTTSFTKMKRHFCYTGAAQDLPNTDFFDMFLEFKKRVLKAKESWDAAEKKKRKDAKARKAAEDKKRRKAEGGGGGKRKNKGRRPRGRKR